MISKRLLAEFMVVMVASMLLAASTMVPTMAYAQKYADHLSNYGGVDAEATALSGFGALYLNPDAPMLPVILAGPSQLDMDAVVPSPCSMDKTVLTRTGQNQPLMGSIVVLAHLKSYPTGLDPSALRGPPRQNA
ncbi:MAG: hypothetical protein AAF590_07830 [Pseudomonadota bacterium]